MKYFLIALVFSGCMAKSISRTHTNNPNIAVDLLFEHDGCKVYRFLDGDYRYYAACSTGQATTNWTEDCGSGEHHNCVRHMELPTQNRK